MIDTHTHLNLEPLFLDPGKYKLLAEEAGVERMLIVGTDLETSDRAIALSKQFSSLLVSVGIHPEEAGKSGDYEKELSKRIENHIVHAIGECGLDYSGEIDHEAQKELFRTHMRLARAYDLPLLIHCRNTRTPDQRIEGNAYYDLLSLLQEQETPRFVLHCVSGPLDYIHQALELGGFISFAGNVTYPSAHSIRDIVKITPLNRLLVETDAPFLAPQGKRGQTNEPANVVDTARFVADFVGKSYEEIDTLTTENAREFLKI